MTTPDGHGKIKYGLPTISEYIDALVNTYGRFRTMGEVEAETDTRGEVIFFAGNNAAVFLVTARGCRKSLKCYIKRGLHTKEVFAYLERYPDELLPAASYLENEIFVFDALGNGNYYDLSVADWVEGITLETAIRQAARENDTGRLTRLLLSFENLTCEILKRKWAHGDLKPENIIVRPDGRMFLIDCDAMFIPPLEGRRTSEVGTPPYQHPVRDENFFNKSIDDYPIVIISVSLRALILDPTLYLRYNNSDNIIFYPEEILAGTSQAYNDALQIFAYKGDLGSYNLALKLKSPTPVISDISSMLKQISEPYQTCTTTQNYAADIRTDYGVIIPEPFEKDGLWGYKNRDGQELLPPVYKQALKFSENIAAVNIHDIWQFIDISGRVLINCADYDTVKPFSEGMAAVLKDKKWGYIDTHGKTVIEPRFEGAATMREGVALIKHEDKYGFINSAGNMAIEPIYDYATSFRDGIATVSIGGKEFKINPCGMVINVEK